MGDSPPVVAWLELLDISTKDAVELFHAVDVDMSGNITVEEWIDGVSRIKGDCSAVDAMTMIAALHRIEGRVDCIDSLLTETQKRDTPVSRTCRKTSTGRRTQGKSVVSGLVG